MHLHPGVCGAVSRDPTLSWAGQKAYATPGAMVSVQLRNLWTLNVGNDQTRFGPGDTQGEVLIQTGEESKELKATAYSWGRGGNGGVP